MMASAGAVTPLDAQQFSGTLRGAVQDSSGAVVPDADVTVVSTATNEKHAVKTDAEGRYVVPQLKPGFYRVTVAKSGFKSAAIDEVKLDVQQIRGVDVTLELGQATELVTVVGRTATIETTQLHRQPDDREQAPRRSAAERPQSVLARDACARASRPRPDPRRSSAAAATPRAKSRSTACRTSTPRTTSRSST